MTPTPQFLKVPTIHYAIVLDPFTQQPQLHFCTSPCAFHPEADDLAGDLDLNEMN